MNQIQITSQGTNHLRYEKPGGTKRLRYETPRYETLGTKQLVTKRLAYTKRLAPLMSPYSRSWGTKLTKFGEVRELS